MRNNTRRSTQLKKKKRRRTKRRTCKKQCSSGSKSTRRGGSQPSKKSFFDGLQTNIIPKSLRNFLSKEEDAAEGPSYDKIDPNVRKSIWGFLPPQDQRSAKILNTHVYQENRKITFNTDESMTYISLEKLTDRDKFTKERGITFAHNQLQLNFEDIDFNDIDLNTMSNVDEIYFSKCQFKKNNNKNDVITDVQKVEFHGCDIPNLSFLSSINKKIYFSDCKIGNNFAVLKDVPNVHFTNVAVFDDQGRHLGSIRRDKLIDGKLFYSF